MQYKLWIGGQWRETGDTRIISSPFSGNTIALCEQAIELEMNEAIESARTALLIFKKVSRYARSILLERMANGIELRRDDFISAIVNEAGKPISLAEMEVNRAVSCFQIASEESKRYAGDITPLDSEKSGREFDFAVSYFTPRGIVLAITPFNFPLNLVAHKVAPALAVGAPVILKPSPEAPGPAYILAQVFEECAKFVSSSIEEIPTSSFQVLSCSNELASSLVMDKRISTLSFTGSDKVGWELQRLAQGKKVCLELGGNAAVIIHKDADLERAAKRCAFGAFSYAGQVCISVQKIFIHQDVFYEFKKIFLQETEKIKAGDPSDREIIVGPLINKKARDRIFDWIEEAKKANALFLSSVNAVGNIIYPIVLESVPADLKISTEEVFGPVVILDDYVNIDDAIERVNESRYGLQIGVFTDSDRIMRHATDNIEAGAILFNEIPTFRADHIPYGGIKDSGLGREGIRYAMEEFSERKTIIRWRSPDVGS
jgi:acyl-CoA reductase-like NAD-dependent aldehyde dehydrogenase